MTTVRRLPSASISDSSLILLTCLDDGVILLREDIDLFFWVRKVVVGFANDRVPFDPRSPTLCHVHLYATVLTIFHEDCIADRVEDRMQEPPLGFELARSLSGRRRYSLARRPRLAAGCGPIEGSRSKSQELRYDQFHFSNSRARENHRNVRLLRATIDKSIIFAFHGYPWLIHRLTYRRTGHDNIHVRGYKEEGTTTAPFDMCVINDLDRFHLVGDVIDRVPKLGERAAYAKQEIRDKLIDHREYICRFGDDMPEIKNWTWGRQGATHGAPSTEGDNA